ncbi:protein LOW PSII ACCUMULATION 3, chloroplastic [Coffea eugenioides]|uniref:Protein LPA3-like n=1 Tax=Coffea arabica TaxID=13443 RepID=A0A6P6TPM0_COFAR|nr:protein LOW PSII ACCUMULATION 3, chloroplastic-like isoform X1 [Coffea arabica]XP_027181421.1 protein LOW PSII ACCUMULATION 3, chloroplastic [Coffea eugenioides]
MPLSTSPTAPALPFSSPSHSKPKGSSQRWFSIKKEVTVCSGRINFNRKSRNGDFAINSASRDSSPSVGFDVQFPKDYAELLQQAKEATELAVKDNRQLMEIEFPTAGLGSVPGDGEGGIEMTESMELIREFCDLFITPEKATRTRIFFPEAKEVQFARNSVFGGVSFKLDYLTKPSFFEDFGFVEKVKMADRVKPEDEVFLVAYPYFNVSEMLVVEELYEEAVVSTSRKLIIFNGELDRIRSGYYPPFFYPKLAALNKTLLPKMETVYYIHNFKGHKGGVLFRCYPGPWKVLRRTRKGYICLHQQDLMPSLKEVALDILPSA